MTDLPDRRFTDQQVGLILRTAAELQERDGPPATGGRGLTLAQLEQIAAEAGIDHAVLHRAVARVADGAGERRHNAFVGGPTEIVVERVAIGEVGPDDFDRLLGVARRVTGELGETSSLGRLFGWKGAIEGMKCEVGVSTDAGRTAVRVRVSPDELLVGNFMVKVMLGGAMGGLVTGLVAGSLIAGPVGAIGFAMPFVGYAFWRRGNTRDLGRVAARAADLADSLAASVTAPAGTRTGAGEIAPRPPLDALPSGISPSGPRS